MNDTRSLLILSNRYVPVKKSLTMHERGRLDSHRQIGFFRGRRFAPFQGRVHAPTHPKRVIASRKVFIGPCIWFAKAI